MRAVVPTPRSAALLAAIALCALVAPLALCGAAAVALVAAAGVDAWLVRAAPAIARTAPPVLSLGVVARLPIAAHAVDARDVALRQAAAGALEVRGGTGTGALAAQLVGRRRGRHELPGVASASTGPLGLARVHHPAGAAIAIPVYPDLVSAGRLVTRLRRDLAAHAGLAARGRLGPGTEFESIRDYTPDDDIRQLNWRASARLGRPMSNQYRLERDRDVVCLIDAGRLMSAPVGQLTMLDACLNAVTVLALAADELGDRCGAVAFDDRIRIHMAPAHRAGRRIVQALVHLQPTPVESNFERAFVRVGASRRALIVVFTDLVDEAAARSLAAAVPMLARRHALVVVSARDPGLEAPLLSTPRTAHELAAAVVARDVLSARERAATLLRRAGATVLEAAPDQLGPRCLTAYLEAKTRMRL